MPENAFELCAKLEEGSVCVDVETQQVRLDDATELTDQTYLRICGTVDGYRWLARLLDEMAEQVDRGTSASAVLSPRDLKALLLNGWDSIELHCKCVDQN